MADIISLRQPSIQLRKENIEDDRLFSELRTLTRDLEKHFKDIAVAVNILDGKVVTNITDIATNVTNIDTIDSLEAWHEVGSGGEPAFENSWVNGSTETVAFYKDPWGVVHLKGKATGGTINTVIFTLPTGNRPSNTRILIAAQGANITRIRILSDGSVDAPTAVANTNQSIEVSFRP